MQSFLKLILVVVIVSGLLGGLSFVVIKGGWYNMNVPHSGIFKVNGIDISHHQGEINWEIIDSSDVRFAFVKVSEGGDHKDQEYKENISSAMEKGIAVSPYHYFSFCKSAKEQFINFNSSLAGVTVNLPWTLDLEYDNNCNTSIAKDDFLNGLVPLVKMIYDKTGKSPILYCNEDFYYKYINGVVGLEKCPLWIRNVVKKPNLIDGRSWLFWQYSDQGSLSGIKEDVDLNVFNGSLSQFKTLVSPML